jgi:hypothetical protein
LRLVIEASLERRAAEHRYRSDWSGSRQILHFVTADLPNISLIEAMICSDMATNATINTCQSSVMNLDASLPQSVRLFQLPER